MRKGAPPSKEGRMEEGRLCAGAFGDRGVDMVYSTDSDVDRILYRLRHLDGISGVDVVGEATRD